MYVLKLSTVNTLRMYIIYICTSKYIHNVRMRVLAFKRDMDQWMRLKLVIFPPIELLYIQYVSKKNLSLC